MRATSRAERGVALGRVEALQRHQLGARRARARAADPERAQRQAAREAPLALARAARQRRQPPRVAPEQRHDAIRLAVVHRAQHDRAA